jgi:AcrR family transcriptional regulator
VTDENTDAQTTDNDAGDATPLPDRRTRLVEAARELFFTRGYDATRMIDVARGAGFSKRTVYLEFESKDELFATICEEGVSILSGWLVESLDPKKSTVEVLQRLGQAYLRFYREHHEYFKMLFLRANDDILSNVPEEQIARIRDLERAGIDAIAQTIQRAKEDGLVRSDIDPHKQAVVGWCSLTGVLQVEDNGRRIDLADGSIEDLYWQCFDILLRGATDWSGAAAQALQQR